MQNAIRLPAARWPVLEIIFLAGEPECRLGPHISDGAILRDLHPTHSRSRVEDAVPLSVALEAAGAEIVPRIDFRAMGENGHLEHPLVSTKFQVWELPA